MKTLHLIMAWVTGVLTMIVVGLYLYMLLYSIPENSVIVDIFKPLFIFYILDAIAYVIVLLVKENHY